MLYFVEAVLWCCLQTLVTKQTGPAGKPVNTLYIAHKMKLKNEMYFAMLLDRGTMGPMIIACSEGTLFWRTLPVLTLCSEGVSCAGRLACLVHITSTLLWLSPRRETSTAVNALSICERVWAPPQNDAG